MIILLAKLISYLSKLFNLGSGATWPGEIALKLDPEILRKIAPKNVILVAGTNGKTTTALMIKTILENGGHKVIHNASGANLLNGVVSAIITSPPGDWGVFEVDENSLPLVMKFIKDIKIIVLLNLFRDQLDRYGEVDVIADKWKVALQTLKTSDFKLVLNADDPLVASLGKKNTLYFGLNDRKRFQKFSEHAMDSQFCPRCGEALAYDGTYYSHIGIWHCPSCGLRRPTPNVTTAVYPLAGIYNRYNTLAAVTVAKVLDLPVDLNKFQPAFGRQEEINGVKVILSKNPASFNESLRTAIGAKAKKILLVLNDRIPDGRDVSWIWDVDFEMLGKQHVLASGDRQLDLALRLKYAGIPTDVVNLSEGVKQADYILATYSAMLEVRKILTGKRIL
ncbi:DUF1727 domain-containing protein [Candidatus Microgenomates bacterium]|nr:DUF1727 domain-containing protein [Candidatus Microgenomates bacterium]